MEEKILEQFLYADKLKFSEIEKALKVRSNLLNYHLKKLVSKGVLVKNKESYELSESSEYLIPYLSSKKHVLSVVLVHVGDNKSSFLVERKKRPYKGRLSLPGGRLIMGESIEEGAKRILKKFGVFMIKFNSVRSVRLEHLKRNGKIVASYLLIYCGAEADCELISLRENKSKIIESDYKLMTEDFKKRLDIKSIDSKI